MEKNFLCTFLILFIMNITDKLNLLFKIAKTQLRSNIIIWAKYTRHKIWILTHDGFEQLD